MTSRVDLNTRFGGGGRNPSEKDLEDAVSEVFHQHHPSLVEDDFAEHPNASLSFGFQAEEKWTVHVLDLYRSGRIIFSKFDDQDDAEPVFEHTMNGITEQQGLWWTPESGPGVKLWKRWERGVKTNLNHEKEKRDESEKTQTRSGI